MGCVWRSVWGCKQAKGRDRAGGKREEDGRRKGGGRDGDDIRDLRGRKVEDENKRGMWGPRFTNSFP